MILRYIAGQAQQFLTPNLRSVLSYFYYIGFWVRYNSRLVGHSTEMRATIAEKESRLRAIRTSYPVYSVPWVRIQWRWRAAWLPRWSSLLPRRSYHRPKEDSPWTVCRPLCCAVSWIPCEVLSDPAVLSLSCPLQERGVSHAVQLGTVWWHQCRIAQCRNFVQY